MRQAARHILASILCMISLSGCGLVATSKSFIPPAGSSRSDWSVDSRTCKNFANGGYFMINGMVGQALDEDAYIGCMEQKGYVHDGWGWNWHKFKPEKRTL